MKAKIEVEGKSFEITLNESQMAEIGIKPFDYTDLKTIEQVFSYLGMDHTEWLKTQQGQEDDEIAYKELKFIAKAINGGIVMDYKNPEVKKFYAYFNSSGSPLGFSCYVSDYGLSGSGVGSRLCFIDSPRAIYAGKQFLNFYDRYIN